MSGDSTARQLRVYEEYREEVDQLKADIEAAFPGTAEAILQAARTAIQRLMDEIYLNSYVPSTAAAVMHPPKALERQRTELVSRLEDLLIEVEQGGTVVPDEAGNQARELGIQDPTMLEKVLRMVTVEAERMVTMARDHHSTLLESHQSSSEGELMPASKLFLE